MGRAHDPPPTISEPLTAAVQVPTIKPFEETDLSDEALAHREYIFNKAVGPSPKISCTVNRVEVRALADTGSEVTTITKSLYLKNFQSQIEDTTYWLHIGAANYEGVAYLGYTELDVEIDGKIIHKAGILIQEDPTDPMKIQQKLELPMTLGCNIINRLVHDKLQEPLRAYLQLTHHTPMATCNNIKVNLDPKHPGKKYAFAKSNRKSSILIPACTEMTVQATTVNLKQTFEAIVESNPFNLPSGIIIYPTYQTVKGGQVNVQVGNTTNEDIYLPRNQEDSQGYLS